MTTLAAPARRAAAGYGSLLGAAGAGTAVSGEAQTIRIAASEVLNAEARSIALFDQKQAAITEILALADERQLSAGIVQRAIAFIRALPGGSQFPEFAVEPSGSISMDWIRSAHCLLSVSVGPWDRLPFAWLNTGDSGHGVVFFDRETIPERILDEIKRVFA